MPMSPQQIARLEKLEQFVERLTLNSFVAKAAASDGEDAEVFSKAARFRNRGEQILAKAVTALESPDALMALGGRTLKDATQMGEFSSLVALGDLPAARRMLDKVSERSNFAKAVDTAEDMLNEPLSDFSLKRAVSEMTARFGHLERTVMAVEARLQALERPQVAPAAMRLGEQQIVKAAAPGKTRRRTPAEESNRLLSMLDAYVDSPTTAGQVSSLIQAGRLQEAREFLERAKTAHETAKLKAERAGWSK